jgi:hypothetical protein
MNNAYTHVVYRIEPYDETPCFCEAHYSHYIGDEK